MITWHICCPQRMTLTEFNDDPTSRGNILFPSETSSDLREALAQTFAVPL